ncbi:hypothetical protein QBC35DRAFT_542057, partial [Podospora australis]
YGSENHHWESNVVVEKRKIFINHLSKRHLSENYVREILYQYASIGRTPGEVQTIEIPRSSSNDNPRGTALVAFGSTSLATTAIDALNGRKVEDKTLVARFAEPVPVQGGGGFSSRPKHRHDAPPELHQGESSRSSRSSAPSKPSSSFFGGGNSSGHKKKSGSGSSGKSSKSATKVEREPPSAIVDGTMLKQEGPPMIVDGSGGRGGRGRHNTA